MLSHVSAILVTEVIPRLFHDLGFIFYIKHGNYYTCSK